jgi:hypothetical protein
MIFQLDTPHLIEYSVEIGYGVIYALLAFFTYKKQHATQNKLAKYFFLAFVCLSLSGLYGGIAGILNRSGYNWIPFLGVKILEIYVGLTLIALIFFLIGLMKLRK